MSIIKIIGLFTFLSGFCLSLPAQNPLTAPRNLPTPTPLTAPAARTLADGRDAFLSFGYLVERFTTDNGLPSNGIKGLQWDPETGFLWIATEAGITRYNGTDFVSFSHETTPGLASERMLFLLKSLSGRIYSSDEAGDLFFIMGNRLQYMGQVRVNARPSTFRLTGLIASGRLFRQSSTQPPADFGFNFFTETLIPLSEDRLIFTHLDSLYDYRTGDPVPRCLSPLAPGSKVFSLAGKLFVFDSRHRLFRLDLSYRPIPIDLLSPGLLSTDPRQPSTKKQPLAVNPPAGVKLFWDNTMESPILVSGNRAWLLEYIDGQLTSRLICSVIPPDAMLSYVKYDRLNEILFLGTDSKGILVIRKNQVRPVQPAATSAAGGPATYSQIALSGDAILSSQGDVFGDPRFFPRKTLPITRFPFNNFTFTTAEDLLWYSRGDSICSYSYRTGKISSIPAGVGSITDGFALSGGRLYIANAIGIGWLEDGRVDYQYRYPVADINNNVPFNILEIIPGQLAIASCNGLFRYYPSDHRLDTLLCIPGICVRSLWKYKDYLFIGTYGRGIFLYHNDTLRSIPADKNGYLRFAHCFISDPLGFCWISTNKGLFRARPDDMIAAFRNPYQNVYYHFYGRKDGMDITELNGGCQPCALRLNDTVLSFPSMDGLLWVDPTRPPTRLPEGKIYIDAFVADSQNIGVNSLTIPNLSSTTRELDFSLGYPAWADRENIEIDYRLDPYSKNWQPSDVEANPKLHFSNLPSGHYRLVVRKSNGFDQQQYSYTEFSFIIEPQWYQQLWVWLLGLCLLAAGVIGIVQWRTRRFQIRQDRLEKQIAEKTRELQAKNEELEKTDTIKTRLISIISHDLITPLRFLHLTGKNLIEKKQGLTEELQQEAIAEIATTSKELELLSTNILNWIKYRNEDRRMAKESFSLYGLVAQLYSIFNVMARQKQILLINAIDPGLVLYQLIDPVRIVLYNLILNGINFTAEGQISVSSSTGRDHIGLLVEDTGVGMTQEQINNIMADHFIISSTNVDNRKGNGLGYLIIKDLMKILRGSLHIQSEKDKGSRITVWVPFA